MNAGQPGQSPWQVIRPASFGARGLFNWLSPPRMNTICSIFFQSSPPRLSSSLPKKKGGGNGRFLPTVKTFRFLQGQLLGIWLVFPRSPFLSKIGHHSLAPSVPGGKENHYTGEFLENSKQSSRGVDETVLFLKAPKFFAGFKNKRSGENRISSPIYLESPFPSSPTTWLVLLSHPVRVATLPHGELVSQVVLHQSSRNLVYLLIQ